MNAQQPLRNEQRRRLLKGMAGTAGVYTLTVGAPVAAASLNCVAASQSSTTPRAVLTAEPDSWVRVKLPYYSLNDNQGYVHWNSNWYQVTKTSSGYTASLVYNYPFANPGAELRAPDGRLYGLVDYRASQGGQLHVYPENQVVQEPVSGGSCWASVAATLPKTDVNNVINLF